MKAFITEHTHFFEGGHMQRCAKVHRDVLLIYVVFIADVNELVLQCMLKALG